MDDRRFSRTRLREVREAVPLTQVELAVISGVSVRTISYTESGERPPTTVTLGKLARSMGVRLTTFWVADDEDEAVAS